MCGIVQQLACQSVVHSFNELKQHLGENLYTVDVY